MSKSWGRKSLLVGIVIFSAGFAAFGGVNAFFSYTNRMDFCISCHTMQTNFEEYKDTVHYKNASGVRATCADCHVPRDFLPKLKAKIIAVKDVYHQIAGTIDTKEKFEEHRWDMAVRVWDKMKSTNSRECRSCHDFENMDLSAQNRMSRRRHARAPMNGKTCIDCHRGIAHYEPFPPDGWVAPEDDLVDADDDTADGDTAG